MQADSQDLRERVLRALGRGDCPTEIARQFEVSRVWVYPVHDGRINQKGVTGVWLEEPLAMLSNSR
jgi:hypothetical protein